VARGARSSLLGGVLRHPLRLRRRPITRFPSSSGGRLDGPPMSRFGIPPERESLYH
jgi:hypothetical protein